MLNAAQEVASALSPRWYQHDAAVGNGIARPGNRR